MLFEGVDWTCGGGDGNYDVFNTGDMFGAW